MHIQSKYHIWILLNCILKPAVKGNRKLPMFYNCVHFNQPLTYDSVNNYWITSAVTDMSNMFYGCTVFNNGDELYITSGLHYMNWNVTYFVTTPAGFSVCTGLTLAPAGNSPFSTSG